jgi:hypothetical protein
MHYRLIVSVLFWLVIRSGAAVAQDAPDLIVTLKDTANTPVAGARVIVRDSGGSRDIAHASTDAAGTAIFATLMETDIRVAVEGQLPSGATLYQPGNDARGMLVFLQAGTTRVNLLVDTDGLVAPDPRTMAALEPGIPIATAPPTHFPTAPLAATPTATAIPAIPQPTFQALAGRTGGAGSAEEVASEEDAAPANPLLIWLGVALLIVLLCAGIGILMLQRRWR